MASIVWVLAAGVLGYQVLLSLEASSRQDAWSAAQLLFVTGLLIILGLSLLTGWALAKSVLLPMRILAEQVTALARGGRAESVPVRQSNEIGDLSARFNTMLHALQSQSRAQSQVIMDQFAGALVVADAEGVITGFNRAACDLFGVTAEAVLGRGLGEVFAGSGDEVEGMIGRVLSTHEPLQAVEVTLHRGETPVRLSVTATIQHAADGTVAGLVLNLRDLEQIEAFHERMKQSEQFAAVSTFASGVAHEIRNPLASIKAIAQLLGEDLHGNERAARFTRVIDSEVNRLEQIVKELQAFTHSRAQTLTRCDLAALIPEALALARLRFVGEAPEVEIAAGTPVPVRGHGERLLQALFHVLLNALEAAERRGRVWVRLRTEENPAVAIVEVENSGSHVAPEDRERIFTPFYTTKATGPGLGLAVARQILHQHLGSIAVESGADHVVFRMTLPRGEMPEETGDPAGHQRADA